MVYGNPFDPLTISIILSTIKLANIMGYNGCLHVGTNLKFLEIPLFGSWSSKPPGLRCISFFLDQTKVQFWDPYPPNRLAYGEFAWLYVTGGLEDKDPKTDSGCIPKSCKYSENMWKPSGSEDQDPKSEISKITFASWIRGFCEHLSHPCFFWIDFGRWPVMGNLIDLVCQIWPLLTAPDLFW